VGKTVVWSICQTQIRALQRRLANSRTKNDFQIEIVPTEGISAANWMSGEFGTSPLFGQLSAKQWA
jgi:hypothetical protein